MPVLYVGQPQSKDNEQWEEFCIDSRCGFYDLCSFVYTFPGWLSNFVTGSVPSTSLGLIDMRATYGGMSIAIGLLMLLLANNQKTLGLGLLSVIAVLMGMVSARILGVVIDGNPNKLLNVYLAAEIIPSIFAFVLYQRSAPET